MTAAWAPVALALFAAAPSNGRPEPKTALERLARQVAGSLEERGAEPPVAVYVHAESAELERAFTSLLSAELSARSLGALPVHAPTVEAAEPAARALGARSLARVTLTLEHGLLQARGDLLGTWVNFWSGGVPTRPATPSGAIAQSTEADAHALAFFAQPLPPTPALPTGPVRLQFAGAPLARLDKPTAALAAGDLDGDGKDELLALTDDELIAYAADGRVLARRDLRSLPPSPTPCREPAGALAVYGNRVAYLSARHARGELLELDKPTASFRPVGTVDQAPLGAGAVALSGQLLPGQSTFAPDVTFVGKSNFNVGGPFVALSAWPSQAGADVLVVYPNGAGARLTAPPNGAPPEPLSGLGAASALVDLDGDGRAELVTTSPLFAPDQDELRVLDTTGKTVLWQAALTPRGRALQAAGVELERGKPRAIVLGVWLPDGTSELHLFRRTSP